MSIVRIKHEISINELKDLKSKCPVLSKLIVHIGEIESYYIPDYFTALVYNVVYQSISYVAATSVWNRFEALFDDIKPGLILDKSVEDIKRTGLSKSKAIYIHNIAKAFVNKEIRLDFENMTNTEVKNELQKIKGIGPWTSEMFLIFSLYRKDVFSFGDIAIKRGIEWLYDVDHDLSKKEFAYYENLFSPHLTIASFYLWEITLRKMLSKIANDILV